MDEEDSASEGPAPRGERNALKRRREQVREASRRFRERKKMEMDEMAGQVQALRDELDAARAALASAGLDHTAHASRSGGSHTASTAAGGSSRAERAEVSQLKSQIASLQAQLGKGGDGKGSGGKYGTRSRGGHVAGSVGHHGPLSLAGTEGAVPAEQHEQLYASYTQTVEALNIMTERTNMLLSLLSRVRALCGKSLPPPLSLEVNMALQAQAGSGGGMGMGMGAMMPASVMGEGFLMAQGAYPAHLPGATPGGSGRTTPDTGLHAAHGQAGGGRGTPAGGQAGQDSAMLPLMMGYAHPYGTDGSDFGGSAGGAPMLGLPPLTMAHAQGSGTGMGMGMGARQSSAEGGGTAAAYIPMAAIARASTPREAQLASIRGTLDTAMKDIAAFAQDEWEPIPWPDTVIQQHGQGAGRKESAGSAEGQPQTVPDPVLQLEWQVPLSSPPSSSVPQGAQTATVSMRLYSREQDLPILSTKWTARVMGVSCEQMTLALWAAHTQQEQARLFSERGHPGQKATGTGSGSATGSATAAAHPQLTLQKVDTLDDKDPTMGTVVQVAHPALEASMHACEASSSSLSLTTCCGVRRLDAVPCTTLASFLDSPTVLPPLTEVDGEEAGYGNAGTGEVGVQGEESDPLLWLGILRSVDGTSRAAAVKEEGGRECGVYGGWIIKRSKVGALDGCVVIFLEQLDAGLTSTAAAAVHEEYIAQWAERLTALVSLAAGVGESEARQASTGASNIHRMLSSSPGRAGIGSMAGAQGPTPPMPMPMPLPLPLPMPMPMPMPVAYAPAYGGVMVQSSTPRTQGSALGMPGQVLTPMGRARSSSAGEGHGQGQGQVGASTGRHRASPSHAGAKRGRTSSMASRDGGGAELPGPLPARAMNDTSGGVRQAEGEEEGQGDMKMEGDNVSGSNMSGLDMLVQFLGPNGR